MIGGLGTTELIIILVIVLVIFGAGKLPEVGGALGKGIRNFKRASKGEEDIDVTPSGTKRNEALQDSSDDVDSVGSKTPESSNSSSNV